ncbi:MAG: hypothetical protein ACYDC2_04815 [Solirubrobacteraceae bacterium]
MSSPSRIPATARPAITLAVLLIAAAVLGACGSAHPPPIAPRELAEAQAFPYYPVYWVGGSFQGHALTAADGLRGYLEKSGDSVYYGDCVESKGIFGGGSCSLPLQVTTVIYHQHPNGPLGPQRNILLRGVPATVYDAGHSIELYTGRVAIDVFADSFAHALAGAERLLPINTVGSAEDSLPPPVYCPGLAGTLPPQLAAVMESLPGSICRRTREEQAFRESLSN